MPYPYRGKIALPEQLPSTGIRAGDMSLTLPLLQDIFFTAHLIANRKTTHTTCGLYDQCHRHTHGKDLARLHRQNKYIAGSEKGIKDLPWYAHGTTNQRQQDGAEFDLEHT